MKKTTGSGDDTGAAAWAHVSPPTRTGYVTPMRTTAKMWSALALTAGGVALSVSAGALGGLAAVSPLGPVPAAAAATAPRCTTSSLDVWLSAPAGGGAAGSYYYHLELTNLSGGTCTVSGYPGVSAVNLAGHQLGKAAARNPVHPPGFVTLENDSTAVALVQLTDVGVYPHSACRPTTAAGLRVYPPDQKTSKIAPFPFLACAAMGPVYLHVEAVERS